MQQHRAFVLAIGQIVTAFLLALTTSTLQAATVGPNNSFYLVQDFYPDWQVYDERYKSYVPFVRERHQNYRSVSIMLNLEANRGYSLLYFSKNENYLFINASLQRKLPANTWVVMNMDSLLRTFQKSEILVTLFGISSGIDDKTLLVGNRISAVQKTELLSQKQLTALPRPSLPYQDFFVITGLFLLVIYAFLYNFQARAFERFYSIKDLITFNKRIDLNAPSNRPFEISNILFLVLLSFLLGYLYLFLASKGVNVFGSITLFEESESFFSFSLTYLEVTVGILLLLLTKYVMLVLLGGLYRLEKITNLHFFKIIQASNIFFLGLIILVFALYFSLPTLSETTTQVCIFVVIGFFLLRLVLLYFAINKLTSLKNLYLFSYLCIVELIPLIVGVRFAL
ncbi:MAG: DUF4271 domain-containing protein [Spirosomataceae bacterium]